MWSSASFQLKLVKIYDDDDNVDDGDDIDDDDDDDNVDDGDDNVDDEHMCPLNGATTHFTEYLFHCYVGWRILLLRLFPSSCLESFYHFYFFHFCSPDKAFLLLKFLSCILFPYLPHLLVQTYPVCIKDAFKYIFVQLNCVFLGTQQTVCGIQLLSIRGCSYIT